MLFAIWQLASLSFPDRLARIPISVLQSFCFSSGLVGLTWIAQPEAWRCGPIQWNVEDADFSIALRRCGIWWISLLDVRQKKERVAWVALIQKGVWPVGMEPQWAGIQILGPSTDPEAFHLQQQYNYWKITGQVARLFVIGHMSRRFPTSSSWLYFFQKSKRLGERKIVTICILLMKPP